ncbi:MAG: Toluene-induced BbsI protein-like protein [Myxococcaceae bacterium]|nr:Toluene-induced BbsI protein-like protein [Myxococcaceae bacterium]
MRLTSKSISQDQPIPKECALGVQGAEGPEPGPNKSPHLAWSGAPVTTKSYALLCVDIDAPARADDANKSDRTIPADFPRAPFYHWVLADIPISRSELTEGVDASGLTVKGKEAGHTPHGERGLNSYTQWFKGDPQMEGQYAGYDGPWPPFNDERVHRYVFTLYALDVESLGLGKSFSGPDVVKAIEGHVVAESSITGTYTLNPGLL